MNNSIKDSNKSFTEEIKREFANKCSNCGKEFGKVIQYKKKKIIVKRDEQNTYYCLECANYHRNHFPWLFIKDKNEIETRTIEIETKTQTQTFSKQSKLLAFVDKK